MATKRLEGAIARLSQLPAETQDAIAARVLEEIEDELHWDEQFARSQDALARLADQARAEIRAGLTEPLDAWLDEPDEGPRKKPAAP